MRTVAEFRRWAARQWPRRFPDWLVDPSAQVSWPLLPPKEHDALAAPDEVAAWVRDWQQAEGLGVAVEWVERRWPALGRQRLPARVSAGPDALARTAGATGAWARALGAAELLRRHWPDVEFSDAFRACARNLGALDEPDVVRLLAVLAWLGANPESGLWERELPVEGVDTKWFERHRGMVEQLFQVIGGRDAGLRRRAVRFRVRILDPTLAPGPQDFAVDLPGLESLDVRPTNVLVAENLTTLDTLPAMPGTVAVHGMGFAAPALAEVGWIRSARVSYWGDLDTYGFWILGQVRAVLPDVRSVLMDLATLEANRAFCVPEPRPFRGVIGHLTVAELHTLAAVRAEDLRLEQERIPRGWASERLTAPKDR